MALPAARMAASRQLRRSVVPISRRAKIAASAACASLNSSARGGRAEAVLRPHIEVQLKAQAKARVRCLRRATARALEQTSLCPRSLLQPMGAMAPPLLPLLSPPRPRAPRTAVLVLPHLGTAGRRPAGSAGPGAPGTPRCPAGVGRGAAPGRRRHACGLSRGRQPGRGPAAAGLLASGQPPVPTQRSATAVERRRSTAVDSCVSTCKPPTHQFRLLLH
jgi:hypothetical protein